MPTRIHLHERLAATALIVVITGALAGCNALAGWDDLPRDASARPDSQSASATNVGSSASGGPHRAGPVSSLAMSAEHACAVVGASPEATTMCWGRNVVGQLGVGDTNPHLTPTAVVGLRGVKSIAAGLLHTCAVDEAGSVWCWGSNKYAALGRGTKDEVAHPKPERLVTVSGATRVHCGMNFSCAETGEIGTSTVHCWGTNDVGQLGHGTTTGTNLPKEVAFGPLDDVVSLSAGSQHVCAVVSDPVDRRVVYCWGKNDHGQLGQPTSEHATLTTPTVVPGLADVAQVFAGDSHTCAVLDDGAVKCWGANDQGQLGVPPSADQPIPTSVPGLSEVASLGIGTKHTCAMRNDQLFCWGSNLRGQLGVDPAVVPQSSAPRLVRVDGLLEQSSYGDARGDHSCAVRLDGALFCWGANEEGQVGSGRTGPSSAMDQVRF